MDVTNADILLVCFPGVDISNQIINEIFVNAFKSGSYVPHETHTFQWDIETKYFTAQLSVCACSHEQLGEVNLDECNRLDAIVLLIDFNDFAMVNDVKRVMSKVKDKGVEICLLYACTNPPQDDDVRDDFLTCCIDNNFELIENKVEKSEDESDDEDESAFDDKVGVERVVEALKSHVWENKKMKIGPSVPPTGSFEDGSESHEGDGEEDLSFNDLFGQFMAMKETAKTLGGEERKAYAEKVSLAFMEALGIRDSDDDHDDPIR